jgi:hypothetical protein
LGWLQNALDAKRVALLFFCIAVSSAHASDAKAGSTQASHRGAPAEALAARGRACPGGEQFDAGMRMCMPNQKGTAPPVQSTESTARRAAPAAPTEPPRDSPGMSMSMAQSSGAKSGAMVRVNQFTVFSHTSGPRGAARLTGPGMWMVMYDTELLPRNHLSANVMGTPEHPTVGDRGTPQLLQTENADAMHPHDYVMALELRDSVELEPARNEQLTFLIAPRGEASVGPVPFMHRASASGNPDAPLGHGLQDAFHDVSTVLGIAYQIGGTTVEATAFSGAEIAWPFPLHRPDSYGVRVTRKLDQHLAVGASYADALLPDEAGSKSHDKFIGAWLTGSYSLGAGTLEFSVIYGRGRMAKRAPQNSFLEEAVYHYGRNSFYDRAEALQVSPAQLDIPSAHPDPKWVEAFTLGYERTVLDEGSVALFAGASYTRDFMTTSFARAYGSDPNGEKLYLRLAFRDHVQ